MKKQDFLMLILGASIAEAANSEELQSAALQMMGAYHEGDDAEKLRILNELQNVFGDILEQMFDAKHHLQTETERLQQS